MRTPTASLLLHCSLACIALFSMIATAHADEVARLLARYKSASGGNAWESATSLHGDGTLSTGGLSGEFHITLDLLSGRSADSYKLGPLEGADGYDGMRGWERDPGGEVTALDTPDALRHAHSQAWLHAHAYWYPQRIASTFGEVGTRYVHGMSYHVLSATPKDGDPITLWFADDSGLLARTIQRQGQGTTTTLLDDYREVNGLRLPFHTVTEVTDAAGHVDARERMEVRLEHVTLNPPVAAADFALPAMAQTARIDDANGSTTIAFELVNNHIFIDGKVNGKPARFMVDTGGVNVLTPETARRIGVGGEGKLAAGGVGEQSIDLALARTQEVRIGAAVLAQPVFYIADLGDLAMVEGTRVDGLIGYEVFRRFGVYIDYGNSRLTLRDAAQFAPPADATAVPFEMDDRIPIIRGELDGVPIRISVDTGSRSSLALHAPFVREHYLVARYDAAPEAVLGWGVGGALRERAARFGTLTLGDLAIDGIAGELFTGNKGSLANPNLGGNLGGGVLRRFSVAFDYANRKMYLTPNRDFAKADPFDRSGLWLMADVGALKIGDVAPDSAGSHAGLKAGDRIVAIDGEGVATRALAEWRRSLRELPAGSKLRIEMQRDSKTKTIELVLADRIPAQLAK